MIAWLGLPILAVLLEALCAWRIGRFVVGSFRFHSVWERAGFTIGAGLAVMSSAMLVLGLAGGIYRAALWPAVAVVALSDVRRWRPSKRLLKVGPIALPFLLLLVALLARALEPPALGDGLLYHLPLAKTYSLTHLVRPIWWLRFPVLPLLGDLLFTLQYALAGELAAQANETLIFVACICALYGWGARHFNAVTGALAAAAFAGNPLAANLGSCAYTDMTLTLYFTLALAAAANWRAEGERGWLWAAGAFAGCAAACKYTGILAVIFVAALAARRPRDLARLIGAALLAAAPYYAYIIFFTHNPVFPFLSNWFGYRYWNAEDLRRQLLQMQQTGAGHGLKALLLLPWNLVFAGERFALEAEPSPFCLLALPAMALAACYDRRIRGLLILVAAFIPLWFAKAQFPRYLSPIAPPLNLAAAASLSWLAARTPRVGRWLAAPSATSLACACLLAPSLWSLSPNVRYPRPRNALERYRYLRHSVPGFPLIAELNRLFHDRYSLYSYDADLALFAEGRYMGDWFGPARFGDSQLSFTAAACAESPPLVEHLLALGADHLLYPKRLLPRKYRSCASFAQHFESINEDDLFVLFRINP